MWREEASPGRGCSVVLLHSLRRQLHFLQTASFKGIHVSLSACKKVVSQFCTRLYVNIFFLAIVSSIQLDILCRICSFVPNVLVLTWLPLAF